MEAHNNEQHNTVLKVGKAIATTSSAREGTADCRSSGILRCSFMAQSANESAARAGLEAGGGAYPLRVGVPNFIFT